MSQVLGEAHAHAVKDHMQDVLASLTSRQKPIQCRGGVGTRSKVYARAAAVRQLFRMVPGNPRSGSGEFENPTESFHEIY